LLIACNPAALIHDDPVSSIDELFRNPDHLSTAADPE
jgi:hypothetical protein